MNKKSISGIYQIKNKINNKIYIGSSKDIEKRWKYHKTELNGNRHCNKHLQYAWNEYGGENFEFSILEEVNDLNALFSKEQEYLDTLDPFDDNGYNLCRITNSYHFGYKMGSGTIYKLKNRKFTEDHKRNMSLSSPRNKSIMEFSLEGTLIHIWNNSREIKECYGYESIKGISSCCNLNSGHQSYDGRIWIYKEDFSESLLQEKIKRQRYSNLNQIVQLSLTGDYIQTWDSLADIQRHYNVNQVNIAGCCKGKRKSAKHFKWIYLTDYNLHKDDLHNFLNNLYKYERKRVYKKVVQLDMNYNYINIWKSTMDIENKLHINHQSIVSCCIGKSKSCKGCRWIYEQDYISNNYTKATLNGQAKPVIQMNLKGEIVKEWLSSREINENLNFPVGSIKSVCNGRTKSHKYKGYLWYYKEDYLNNLRLDTM